MRTIGLIVLIAGWVVCTVWAAASALAGGTKPIRYGVIPAGGMVAVLAGTALMVAAA